MTDIQAHHRILLVADLHLSEQNPEVLDGFLAYLAHTAPNADALYVLGDLFDAWIGDDLMASSHPLASVANQVAKALAALAKGGTAVYLMHGNRDFLLGEAFATACQARLLEEPLLLTLCQQQAVLLHGDSLCTADEAYMAFRQQSRDPQWQAQMLALPLQQRLELARNLRQESDSANAEKPHEIMDVTPAEVVRLMQTLDVSLMIHGHTHRPCKHLLDCHGRPAQRLVLGDWSASQGVDICIDQVPGKAIDPQLRHFLLDDLPL